MYKDKYLSFICITYRKAGFYWTLKCLKNQNVKPDEILLILNSGCTLYDALGEEDFIGLENIRILPYEVPHDYSFAMPANYGLDNLDPKSDYTLVVADHSWFHPDWVKTHIDLQLEANPALISGGKKLHDENDDEYLSFKGPNCKCMGTYWPVMNMHDKTLSSDSPEAPKHTNGSSLSIKSDTLRGLHGWDERMEGGSGYEDALLSRRSMIYTKRPLLISMDERIITHRLMCSHRKLTKTHDHNIAIYNHIVSDEKRALEKAWRKHEKIR